MKRYLLVFLIMVSPIFTYAQMPIKIQNKIIVGLWNWPDSSKYLTRWEAGGRNGLLVYLPFLKNEKKVKITDVIIKEKEGMAKVTKDPGNDRAFFIETIAEKILAKKQRKIVLEFWVKFSSSNLLVPIPVNNNEYPIYDEQWRVIPEKVKWQKIEKKYLYKNDMFLLLTEEFLINFPRKK